MRWCTFSREITTFDLGVRIPMSTSLPNLLATHRTLVMGVVNVTADSFSDGGRYLDRDAAIEHAMRLVDEGADILDIGGESTAPTSAGVDAEEESRRVVPIVEELAKRGAYLSVDTYKADVARRALDAGAQMINDVTAFRGDDDLINVVVSAGCDVCIMYAKDATPRTTRNQPVYRNVAAEIGAFLTNRADLALRRGIAHEKIVLDPGMGAFVSGEPEPSLEILARLDEFAALGYPVLVGASRKGFIGQVLDTPVSDRLAGSLACASIAAWNGARIIRAHDVRETVRTVRMVDAIKRAR